MNQNILLLFSISLLFVMIIPAYAQTESNSVVINEVETNPTGNDSMTSLEWIELYNSTDEDVDLSGWQIASTTVLKKTMTISDGTIIKPDKFLIFNYQPLWFTDSNDSIELKNNDGVVIDKTHTFSDLLNNSMSWQRLYDGYDSDSSDDWKFVTASPNSSNGIFVETPESINTIVTVSSDKSSYVFGEVAIIEGHVSEKLFITKPSFIPQSLLIKISGNSFEKGTTLYPDMNLDFKITQSLQQVIGITGGDYLVSVKYGDVISQTTFSVGNETISEKVVQERTMSITTDESQYLPGSNVIFTAIPDFVIPLEGMYFEVHNPDGLTIFSGNLFLVDGKFSTDVFLTTINPLYGTYEIIGEYSDQSVVTTFDLVEDIKEDKLISLWTDKEVYEPGDIVSISGRLNDFWMPSLDIEIIQTRNLSLADSGGFANKISDVVLLQGDSSFAYSFKIPMESGLGDYIIKISKDIGSTTKSFVVSDNPDEYIGDELFAASSDSELYSIGDVLTLTGKITNPVVNSEFSATPVLLTIFDSSGHAIDITGTEKGSKKELNVQEQFSAIPDSSGRFSFKLDLTRAQFDTGSYKINLNYVQYSTDVSFSVIDPLDHSGVILTLDKNVYGFGEFVNLTGLVPPLTDTSVNISLLKPNGSTSKFDTLIDNQKFSWSWVTPMNENPLATTINDDAMLSQFTNLGIYKILINISDTTHVVYFKLSLDPENDFLPTSPLYVTIEKTSYKLGEQLKIVGNVFPLSDTVLFNDVVNLQVKSNSYPYSVMLESKVFPKPNGFFISMFDLHNVFFTTGEYTITSTYHGFTTVNIFDIVDDSISTSNDTVSTSNDTEKPKISQSSTVIEKENRITDKLISISTEEKNSDDTVISPRVISGSLVTPSRADEFDVNLRISTESGICIIGADDECLVHDSTRKSGQIYDVVEVEGLSLNVRYSGPDVRLEKFSILPESSSEFLPDTNWNVDVIKDDQISRFYYKVTYKTLE